ncbi:lysine-specific demethylase ELF6-like [Wolffia australiana]
MGGAEVPGWLQSLPLAPEYRPTETEFLDPIAFISRIEREAAQFGICKIIPPIPKPSKKFVFHNLNRSLSKSPELGDVVGSSSNKAISPGEALFTTRQQELGSRRTRIPAHKQVWQSGELYTVDQFEAKSKLFSRSVLPGGKSDNPLLVEALFWKTLEEKPMYVEYANDVPGSGFCAAEEDVWEGSDGWKLSISPWNLQKIAKSPGSLIRFMPDEVPGVTSPMVYIGMLFSWFAWHVEDHELHSLNFLHMGSPKTWYAVPGSFAEKFEEAVRVRGYGGQVDRLVSFALLGEKTTLVSPEIITQTGIPCCRIVQNPGEFVVTFPKAYHVGFSHGFNCGEAANFASPTWLHVAKEAAVRRATMNHLPMLSHQQLLYMLAMSYISRVPGAFPLDQQREEGETLVKKAFLDDLQNELRLVNALLVNDSGSSMALWHPSLLPSSTISPRKSPVVNIAQDESKEAVFSPEDELPFGLDIDSGTLTCTACGILGYPFMALLQPDKKSTVMSAAELGPQWDLLDQSMRPRIFCMEHAVHVNELLLRKSGSARVLVICHSDYLKIKAQLGEVKLEVNDGTILLRRAAPAELNLIYVAIDEEGGGEAVAEDWTSKMGFNLRNGEKKDLHKLSLQHTLEWQGRRSRTSLPTKKRRGCLTKNLDEPPFVKEEEEEETAKPFDITPVAGRPVVELKQYQRRPKKVDEQMRELDVGLSCFARGPCEGLRPRNRPMQMPLSVPTKHQYKGKGCVKRLAVH